MANTTASEWKLMQEGALAAEKVDKDVITVFLCVRQRICESDSGKAAAFITPSVCINSIKMFLEGAPGGFDQQMRIPLKWV